MKIRLEKRKSIGIVALMLIISGMNMIQVSAKEDAFEEKITSEAYYVDPEIVLGTSQNIELDGQGRGSVHFAVPENWTYRFSVSGNATNCCIRYSNPYFPSEPSRMYEGTTEVTGYLIKDYEYQLVVTGEANASVRIDVEQTPLYLDYEHGSFYGLTTCTPNETRTLKVEPKYLNQDTDELSYQWQKRSGELWEDLEGQTTNYLSVTVPLGYTYYRCVVTGKKYSDTALFKLYSTDLALDMNQRTEMEGRFAKPMTLQVRVKTSDMNTPIYYRWYRDYGEMGDYLVPPLGESDSLVVYPEGEERYTCLISQGKEGGTGYIYAYFYVKGADLYLVEHESDENQITVSSGESFTVWADFYSKNTESNITYEWGYYRSGGDEGEPQLVWDPIEYDGKQATFVIDMPGDYYVRCKAEQGKDQLIYEKSVHVEGIAINNADVKLSQSSYVADGAAKTPDVTVVLDGLTLTKGTDYVVTYRNNVAAGTATAVITGIGRYTGSLQKNFMITKAKQVDADPAVKQSTPQGTTTDPAGTTTKSASKAVKAPGKPGLKSVKIASKSSVKISLKKAKRADGYVVLYATNRKFSKNRNSKQFVGSKTKLKRLKRGLTYYIKVKAYIVDENGEKIYGKWSNVKSIKLSPKLI